MKFTEEEISLCKQIAEKYKRRIEYGSWYINYDGDTRLKDFHGMGYRDEESTPLWTISDCLEFLKEREWRRQIIDKDGTGTAIKVYYDRGLQPPIIKNGKTLLEACLKAVLAVLEEGK